jgi:5'-nucleotidase
VGRGDSGESAIGDVIADARLEAANVPPQIPAIGIVNGGGIRSFLTFTSTAVPKAPGDVTFGEAYNVEPFGDLLETETLTGAQLITLLDEQWIGKKDVELLGISKNLSYTWDASKPDLQSKLVPESVRFEGKPLDLAASYRITVDDFMAAGGDNYVVLLKATQKTPGPVDLDALDAYITVHSPLSPPPRNRITRLH